MTNPTDEYKTWYEKKNIDETEKTPRQSKLSR